MSSVTKTVMSHSQESVVEVQPVFTAIDEEALQHNRLAGTVLLSSGATPSRVEAFYSSNSNKALMFIQAGVIDWGFIQLQFNGSSKVLAAPDLSPHKLYFVGEHACCWENSKNDPLTNLALLQD